MPARPSPRTKPAPADALDRARELLDLARAEGDAGHLRKALQLGDRALRTLGPTAADSAARSTRALVLINQAYQWSGLGRVPQALELLTAAQDADPAQTAAIGATRAMCLMRGGDHRGALLAYDEAVAGLLHGDQRMLSATLLNRGALHMTVGRLREARADTEAALAAAESSGDAWGSHMAAHNLGYLQFLSGDLPGALASMDAAQQAVDDPPVGMPALDRARVLLAAGLVRDAAEAAETAIAEFDRHSALSDLPEALMVAAEADVVQEKWQSALGRSRRARSVNRRRRNDNAALLAELLELKAAAGLRAGGTRRAARARSAAARGRALALALTPDLPADATTASLLAAEAWLDAGDPAAAESDAADAHVTRTAPIGTRLQFRLVAARLQLDAGNRVRGLSQIRSGLDDLADYQARFGSQDMQAGAAVHGAQLARLGLRTALGTGSPATILQWLERSRAVSTRLPAVHPPADQELADLLGQLRLAAIDARAAAVAGSPDPALTRRVEELRKRVRARSWTVSGSGAAVRPLTLAAVQRLLATDPAGPTVIAYLHGATEQHVLVVTSRTAVHRQLGDWPVVSGLLRRTVGDLNLLATARIPGRVRAVAEQSLQGNLRQLDRELLLPVAGDLGDGPVIIAVVGPTATLPWGLLPTLTGRPVSVSSSVTAAMAAVGRPSRAYLRGVLAVAGPDVPGAEAEARAVAGLHAGAGLLFGVAATGDAVLGQLPAGGLLHVAAHGHHEPDSPLFSSVQLADGPLYGYDIAPSPSLPDHVVLSSCDVGRSDDMPGGEPLGLAAALLRSGVSTVVAGVSRIGDDAAAAAMAVYHQRLLAGDGPAVALAAAVASADGAPVPLTCFGAGS